MELEKSRDELKREARELCMKLQRGGVETLAFVVDLEEETEQCFGSIKGLMYLLQSQQKFTMLNDFGLFCKDHLDKSCNATELEVSKVAKGQSGIDDDDDCKDENTDDEIEVTGFTISSLSQSSKSKAGEKMKYKTITDICDRFKAKQIDSLFLVVDLITQENHCFGSEVGLKFMIKMKESGSFWTDFIMYCKEKSKIQHTGTGTQDKKGKSKGSKKKSVSLEEGKSSSSKEDTSEDCVVITERRLGRQSSTDSGEVHSNVDDTDFTMNDLTVVDSDLEEFDIHSGETYEGSRKEIQNSQDCPAFVRNSGYKEKGEIGVQVDLDDEDSNTSNSGCGEVSSNVSNIPREEDLHVERIAGNNDEASPKERENVVDDVDGESESSIIDIPVPDNEKDVIVIGESTSGQTSENLKKHDVGENFKDNEVNCSTVTVAEGPSEVIAVGEIENMDDSAGHLQENVVECTISEGKSLGDPEISSPSDVENSSHMCSVSTTQGHEDEDWEIWVSADGEQSILRESENDSMRLRIENVWSEQIPSCVSDNSTETYADTYNHTKEHLEQYECNLSLNEQTGQWEFQGRHHSEHFTVPSYGQCTIIKHESSEMYESISGDIEQLADSSTILKQAPENSGSIDQSVGNVVDIEQLPEIAYESMIEIEDEVQIISDHSSVSEKDLNSSSDVLKDSGYESAGLEVRHPASAVEDTFRVSEKELEMDIVQDLLHSMGGSETCDDWNFECEGDESLLENRTNSIEHSGEQSVASQVVKKKSSKSSKRKHSNIRSSPAKDDPRNKARGRVLDRVNILRKQRPSALQEQEEDVNVVPEIVISDGEDDMPEGFNWQFGADFTVRPTDRNGGSSDHVLSDEMFPSNLPTFLNESWRDKSSLNQKKKQQTSNKKNTSKRKGEDSTQKKKKKSGKSKEKPVYCTCRSTDISRFMIGCDNCDEWYHGTCIGITRKEAETIDKFFCDACRVKNSKMRIIYKCGVKAKTCLSKEFIGNAEMRQLIQRDKGSSDNPNFSTGVESTASNNTEEEEFVVDIENVEDDSITESASEVSINMDACNVTSVDNDLKMKSSVVDEKSSTKKSKFSHHSKNTQTVNASPQDDKDTFSQMWKHPLLFFHHYSKLPKNYLICGEKAITVTTVKIHNAKLQNKTVEDKDLPVPTAHAQSGGISEELPPVLSHFQCANGSERESGDGSKLPPKLVPVNPLPQPGISECKIMNGKLLWRKTNERKRRKGLEMRKRELQALLPWLGSPEVQFCPIHKVLTDAAAEIHRLNGLSKELEQKVIFENLKNTDLNDKLHGLCSVQNLMVFPKDVLLTVGSFNEVDVDT